tara:strand:- start:518 stop:1525 length:1008 start_codon:yes stop_codon:yes gene_type:complete
MSLIKAEYIWLDGTEPTAQLRSKTKIIKSSVSMRDTPPVWGFDGSSTNQAPGDASDCVLNPVYTCPDPIRGGNDILVLCEVLNTDKTPHETNTRKVCEAVHEVYKDQQMLFGLEQEYTFFNSIRPLGFANKAAQKEQGDFYCGVGPDNIFGRTIVEEHLDACLKAGLTISGINAEVMPGQWEFQVGPLPALRVSDQLTVARWLLMRIAENHGVTVSFTGKPAAGDWNGAGCHANVSTLEMRRSYAACVDACVALGERASYHIENYGHGIEQRLTGKHETCSYEEFRYGVSDRGASIRIPWQVERDQKGYIEDRRPNANCDPYVVTRLLTETICGY